LVNKHINEKTLQFDWISIYSNIPEATLD